MEATAGVTSEDRGDHLVELRRLQKCLEIKHHEEDKEIANIQFITKETESPPSHPHILADDSLVLLENKLMSLHTPIRSPDHGTDANAYTSDKIGEPSSDFRAVCNAGDAHCLIDGTSEPVDLLAAKLEGNLLGLADFAWRTSNMTATAGGGVSANTDEDVDEMLEQEDAGLNGPVEGISATGCYERPPPMPASGADCRAVLSLPALEGWLRDAAGRVRALADFMGSDARRATHHVDACLVQLKEICEEIWEHVEVIHALQEAEFPLRLLAVSVQVLLDIQAVHLLWHRLRVSTLLLRERVLRGLQLRATAAAQGASVAAEMRGDGAHEEEEEEEQQVEEQEEEREDGMPHRNCMGIVMEDDEEEVGEEEEEEQSETQLLIRRPADYFSLDCGITASELSAYSPREDEAPSPPSLALPAGADKLGSDLLTRPAGAALDGRSNPHDAASPPPPFDEDEDASVGLEHVRDSDSDSDSLPLRDSRGGLYAGTNAADASYLKMSFFGSLNGARRSLVDVCGNTSVGAVAGDDTRSESDVSLDEDDDGSRDALYRASGMEAPREIRYSVASGRAPSGESVAVTNKRWNDTRDSITTFNSALNAASSVAFLTRPTQIHLSLSNANSDRVDDNRSEMSTDANATEGSFDTGAIRCARDDSAAQGRACEYFQASSRPKADDEDTTRGRSGCPSHHRPSDGARVERASNRRHCNPRSPLRSPAHVPSESQYCVIGSAARVPDTQGRRDDAYLALASNDAAPRIDALNNAARDEFPTGDVGVALGHPGLDNRPQQQRGESQEYMALPSLLREPGFLSLKLEGLDSLLRCGGGVASGARVCNVSDWELSGTSSVAASPQAFSPVSDPWDGVSSEGKASEPSGASSPAFPVGSPGSGRTFLSDAASRDSGASSPDGWQAETSWWEMDDARADGKSGGGVSGGGGDGDDLLDKTFDSATSDESFLFELDFADSPGPAEEEEGEEEAVRGPRWAAAASSLDDASCCSIPSLRQELHRCLERRGDGREMEEKIESFVERLLELTSWLQQAEEQAESMGPPRPDTQSLKLYLHNHLSFKMSMESRCVMKDEVVEEGKQFLDLLGARLSGLPGLLGWLDAAWTSLQAHICRQHRWLLAALDVAKAGILASHQARPHGPGSTHAQGEGQLLDLELARDTVEHLSLRLHHERYLGHARGAARAARALALASDARRSDSWEEFGANCLELWDWLCDVEAVMSEDNDLMMSEEHWHQLSKVYRVELTMWLPKKRQIFTQGQELVSLNQTLTDTVRFKLEQLEAKWNSVEGFLAAACGESVEPPACESLSPAAARMVCRLEGRVRELKAWLRDAETLVFDGCVERRTPTDLDRQLHCFKSLCHEIRRRRGGVAALVRLCHRLLEGVGSGDGGDDGGRGADGQNLQLAAVSLERRWEAVVLQAVHWQSRLQRRLNAKQVTLNYVDASQSDLSISPVEGLEWDETADLGNELSAACAEQPPPVSSSTPSDAGKPSAVDAWSMGQSFLRTSQDSGVSPDLCRSHGRSDRATQRSAAESGKDGGGAGRPDEPREADNGQDSFSSTDSLLNLLDGLLLAGSGGKRSCECESGIASEGDAATASDSGLLSEEVVDVDGDACSSSSKAGDVPAYRPDPFTGLLAFAGYGGLSSDDECDEYLDTGKKPEGNAGSTTSQARVPKRECGCDNPELQEALTFYDYSYLKEDNLKNTMAFSGLPTIVIQSDNGEDALDLSNSNKTRNNALTSTSPCSSKIAGYNKDYENTGQLSPMSSFMGQRSSNVFQEFKLGKICTEKGDHFDTMIHQEDFVNVPRERPQSFISSCLAESNKLGKSAYLNESSLHLLQEPESPQAAVFKCSDFNERNGSNKSPPSADAKPASDHGWEDLSAIIKSLENRPASPFDGKTNDGRQSASLPDEDVNLSLIVNTSRASMCSDDEEDDIDLLSSSSTMLSDDGSKLEKDSSSNSEDWRVDSDCSDSSSSLDEELKDQKFYVTPPWENISKERMPLLHRSPMLLSSKLYSRFSVSPLTATGHFFGSSFKAEPGSFPTGSPTKGQVHPLLDDIKNGNVSNVCETLPEAAHTEKWACGDPSIHDQTSLWMQRGAFPITADTCPPYSDTDTNYKYAIDHESEIFSRGDNYPLLAESVTSLTRERKYLGKQTGDSGDSVNSKGGEKSAVELREELSSLCYRASEQLRNLKSTDASNGLGFLVRDDSDSSLSAHTDEDNVCDADCEPITPPPDPRGASHPSPWAGGDADNRLWAMEKHFWTRPIRERGTTLNVNSNSSREEWCVASEFLESDGRAGNFKLGEEVLGVYSFVDGVIKAAVTHIKESEMAAPSSSLSVDGEIPHHGEKPRAHGESVPRVSQGTECVELGNHGVAMGILHEGRRLPRNGSGDVAGRHSSVSGAERERPGGASWGVGDFAQPREGARTRWWQRHDVLGAEQEAALSGSSCREMTVERVGAQAEGKTSIKLPDLPALSSPAAPNENVSTPASSDLEPKTPRGERPVEPQQTAVSNFIECSTRGRGTPGNSRSRLEISNSLPCTMVSGQTSWDINCNSEEQQALSGSGGGEEATPGSAARNSPTLRKRPQMGTRSLSGGGKMLMVASEAPPSPSKERAPTEGARVRPSAHTHGEAPIDGGGLCGNGRARPVPPVRTGWKMAAVRAPSSGPAEHEPSPGSPAQMSIAAEQDQNQRNEKTRCLSGFPKDVTPSCITGEGGLKKVTMVREGLFDESCKKAQESLRCVRQSAADEERVSGAESTKGNLKVADSDLKVQGRNSQVQSRVTRVTERSLSKTVKRDDRHRHVFEKKREVAPKGSGVSASLTAEERTILKNSRGVGGGSVPLTIKGGIDFAVGAGDGADIEDISKVVASHAGRVWNVGCLIWLLLLLVLWLVAVGPSFIAPSNCMRSRASLTTMGITLSYPWGSPPI